MVQNKKVLIIDLDIGNVGSVYRAINKIGCKALVSDKINISGITHIILPGVGSFDHGMKKLIDKNLFDPIINLIKYQNIPLLGICLGMHLLSTYGYENNKKTKGLNLIPGKVEMLDLKKEFKIPHMGWNSVIKKKSSLLFNDIEDHKDFYFVHSYVFNPEIQNTIIAKSTYDKEFISAINYKNIFGVQFHPEKSLDSGIKLLTNFINI